MTTNSPQPDAAGFTYITIPALDVHASGRFYQAVFGWTTRGGDHHLGFTDAHQSIRGAFETTLAISREPGVLPYIYVSDIDHTLELVTRHGGSIVRPRYDEGGLWVARSVTLPEMSWASGRAHRPEAEPPSWLPAVGSPLPLLDHVYRRSALVRRGLPLSDSPGLAAV